MNAKISDKILNIRFGAMYRLATKASLHRQTVESLLTERAGLSVRDAKQLAAHWFTTEPLRLAKPA